MCSAFDEWEVAGKRRNNPQAVMRIVDLLNAFRNCGAPIGSRPSGQLLVLAVCREVGLNSLEPRHHQDSGNKRQSKILGLLDGVVDLFDQNSGLILPRHELSLVRADALSLGNVAIAAIADGSKDHGLGARP
jgi:hypothetical protein